MPRRPIRSATSRPIGRRSAPWRSFTTTRLISIGACEHSPQLRLEDHDGEDRDHAREGGPAEREPDAEQPLIVRWQWRARPHGCGRKLAQPQLDRDYRQPAQADHDIEPERDDDPRLPERIADA